MVGGPGNDLILGSYDGDRILGGTGNDVVNLLGGSPTGAETTVDCGPGRDVVIVNPSREATLRNCESTAKEFHEADFGFMLRPSPEVYP
jgi:Ca2+-binding RTX toxin-like protein